MTGHLNVHMGYPKCASTWFQKSHWATHPDVDLLLEGRDARQQILMLSDAEYAAQGCREAMLESLAETEAAGRIPVLSREGYITSNDRRRKRGISRIQGLDRDVRVFVVIRHQRNFLLSMWQQRVKSNRTSASLDHFMKPPIIGANRPGKPHLALDFASRIAGLDDEFGRQNVHVEMFEEFVKDNDGIRQRVDDFMGIPARPHPVPKEARNPGLSYQSTKMFQRLNRFTLFNRVTKKIRRTPVPKRRHALIQTMIARDAMEGRPALSKDPEVRERYTTMINEHFAEANQALLALRPDLPLAKHKYPGFD